MAKTKADFSALWARALAAGAAAGAAVTPTPMVVSSATRDWFVADGVCGFGWVHFSGATAFGRWAKASGIARPDYPKGLAVSSKLMTQSMARNEAWAHAVAAVLRDGGVADAVGRSRID